MNHKYETKLQLLEIFIQKQETENLLPKPKFESEIVRESISEVNKNIFFETVHNWIKAYKRNDEFLLILRDRVQKNKNRRS